MNSNHQSIFESLSEHWKMEDLYQLRRYLAPQALILHGDEIVAALCDRLIEARSHDDQVLCCYALRGVNSCLNGIPIDLLRRFHRDLQSLPTFNSALAKAVVFGTFAEVQNEIFFKDIEYYSLLHDIAEWACRLPTMPGTSRMEVQINNAVSNARQMSHWLSARDQSFRRWKNGSLMIRYEIVEALISDSANKFCEFGYGSTDLDKIIECIIRTEAIGITTPDQRPIPEYGTSITIPKLSEYAHCQLWCQWECKSPQRLSFKSAKLTG